MSQNIVCHHTVCYHTVCYHKTVYDVINHYPNVQFWRVTWRQVGSK